MLLTPEENKNLVIKESRNGTSIFAQKDFLPEEIIFEVTGTFVTCDLEDDMDEETRSNTYRYDEDLYISPKGTVGDMLNHSCEPNCKVVKIDKKLFVVANRLISDGEECTIDYSTIQAPDDTWEMRCNCGSENCRGIIRRIDSLPQEIIQKYKTRGMIPDYILS